MIFVFDSSSLIVLFRHFYPSRFPTLWQRFDALLSNGDIVSTREVRKELERGYDILMKWAKNHKDFFPVPSPQELRFVTDIFKVSHFQQVIRKQERLRGTPVADPFVIAKARVASGCVVTQERFSENAAKIPNICKHFGIAYTNLEGFMEEQNWTF